MTGDDPAADRCETGKVPGDSSTTGDLTARSRRAFLATSATGALVSLVGCLGDDGDGGGDGDGSGTSSDGGTVGTTKATDYPDEVVIGSVHPLTGSTSYVGKRLHNAVELAATIKNENGGIQSMDGATVEVIKGDHKNDPTVGGEVTRELVDEGADILTGTYSSPVTSAATRVAETKQVPFVIDISVAASILQERDLDYVYRAQPNSWSQASDAIRGLRAVADSAGIDISTIGLFYVDTTYGQAIRDGLRRATADTDLDIVEETTIGFGGTADTQVTKLRQADPDVVVPTAFTNQMLELVGAMKNQEYWPKLLAGCATGGMNNETFTKMGDVINGELTSGYGMNPNTDKKERVNKRFMETYDTASMTANVAMAYSTGEVLIEAFERAASTDADELNRTLQNFEVTDHIMAMPPISFDENGENANPLSVTSQVQDLQTQIVYPDRYAEAELVTETVGR